MNATIRGFVSRRIGGLPAAHTAVVLLNASNGSMPERGTTADQHGWFVFRDISPGSYRVAVKGGQAQDVRVDPMSSVTLEFMIDGKAPAHQVGSTIAGKVIRLDTGFPVADASVMIVSGPAPSPDIARITDASGAFSFSGLAPGEWLLRAIAPTSQSGQRSVYVAAEATALTSIEIDFSQAGMDIFRE
ncbi:MAG: MSCRAMM family protein [Casimicrobium sp.]